MEKRSCCTKKKSKYKNQSIIVRNGIMSVLGLELGSTDTIQNLCCFMNPYISAALPTNCAGYRLTNFKLCNSSKCQEDKIYINEVLKVFPGTIDAIQGPSSAAPDRSSTYQHMDKFPYGQDQDHGQVFFIPILSINPVLSNPPSLPIIDSAESVGHELYSS